MVLLYHSAGTDLWLVGVGNGHWFGGFRLCQGLYPSGFPLPSGKETWNYGNCGGKCAGYRFSAVYVRHDSDRSFLFQRWDERQLAGRIYDGLYSANPQLIIYSTALGGVVLTVRIVSCFLCGITAGLLLYFFYKDKPFFNFSGFDEPKHRDTDPHLLVRYLKNLRRNVKATGVYFLIGVLLSALFQRYVPAEAMTALFGGNEAVGVLMAATIGVPLYACGGGTIPLLQSWLLDGMSVGSAASFMLTGPSTKITNLGALKIVLGLKHFLIYMGYVMLFSFVSGMIVNWIV